MEADGRDGQDETDDEGDTVVLSGSILVTPRGKRIQVVY